MKANFLPVLLVIGICAMGSAAAQDVQGASSGTAGKPVTVEKTGQERLKGQVIKVDEASGTMDIRLSVRSDQMMRRPQRHSKFKTVWHSTR